MAESAKIMTLHDHDTGEAVAPRTDVKALSGKGKKWNYVGFTEDNQVGLIEGTWPCNRNILDNWYYVNPVNQRTQKIYTGAVYGIDRWVAYGADTTVTINDDCLEVTCGPETNGSITQRFETGTIVIGRIYTFSVLVKEVSGTASMTVFGGPVKELKPGMNCITFLSNAYQDSGMLPVYRLNGTVKLIAAKLELGPTQTLAHKEGDTWVLNEIPNYAEELAKCQRYQLVLTGEQILPARTWGSNETKCNVTIATPVTMRSIPAITPSSMTDVMNFMAGSSTYKGISIVAKYAHSNSVMAELTIGEGAGVNEGIALFIFGNTLILDANL